MARNFIPGLSAPQSRPVRNVTSPSSGRHTGKIHSFTIKATLAWESTLERDALLLLDFDAEVTEILVQPQRITLAADTDTQQYTPDFLITRSGKQEYIEVKFLAHLQDPATLEKLERARAWAEKERANFRVISEDIRDGELLNNVNELRRLTRLAVSPSTKQNVAAYFRGRGFCSIGELTHLVKENWEIKGIISQKYLRVDLSKQITASSRVSLFTI
jgi:hypothetical protein